jgi:hypothetical protein
MIFERKKRKINKTKKRLLKKRPKALRVMKMKTNRTMRMKKMKIMNLLQAWPYQTPEEALTTSENLHFFKSKYDLKVLNLNNLIFLVFLLLPPFHFFNRPFLLPFVLFAVNVLKTNG